MSALRSVGGAATAATEADRLARVTLSVAVEPGDITTSRLVRDLGPQRALSQQLVPKPGSGLAERLAEVDPARHLEQAERKGIRFLVPGDAEWPAGLDDLDQVDQLDHRCRTGDDPDVAEPVTFGGTPPGIWVRGPMPLTELVGSVAVVGSRSASVYGVETARAIAGHLALSGVPVVSGGALGIDFVAHDAALRAGGATAAVLACGVDRVYPEKNRALLAHLAAEYAVVSEQPPGSGPTQLRFLARNRLIAALTCGTVLVEAALRSGALNTVGWAEQMSRSVMGVPGPVTSYTSAGVHQCLRRGGATLVTQGSEVLEVVGRAGEHLVEVPRGPERPRDRLSAVERRVLEQVPPAAPAAVDAVASLSLLHVRDTMGALSRLEAKGFVVREDGGWRLAGAG
ncbi:DNA processing protein DprA [Nocardioides flavus (ex Wang et al. 2016)]|uniref:DNA processing protein DprA n=1 Tax=Nocardioides flavus (ex Wang et al. 2016) TaxID=2058780 RepID=A0ABQ3HLT5_9ACTN|nr:DNA-processing protein DprA [Nocardioides flavus (ex Wang et al. 2016)]GHE17387.1 DNA processing protein DprA [Nocardioides flavus (ex Wang et al. 2016)]